jgi:hypothetical protein
MSWNVSVRDVVPGELYDKLEEATEVYFISWGNDQLATVESVEQAAVASDAAQVLATALQGGRLVNATISGHANPDHDPSKGAPEYISVSVAH